MLIIGSVQLLTAMLIMAGKSAGQILGVILACISLVSQLLFLNAYPVWSVIIMVIDLMVIYGLTVYGHNFVRK